MTIAKTYSESAKGMWITWDRVLVELARHGISNVDLAKAELKPRKGLYSAAKLMTWLGY